MGRKLNTTLPSISANQFSLPDFSSVRENDKCAKSKYKLYYDNRHGVKSELNPGDKALIKLDKSWATS